MTIRRRPLRAGPAVLAVLLAVSPAPSAATASPPTTGPTTPASAGDQDPAANTFSLAGVAPGNHQITLITGDRVTLVDAGGGRYRISAERVTRGDGTKPSSMEIRNEQGGVYAVPDDAVPAIATKRLDRELFNVRYLAENGYTDASSTAVPLILQYPGVGAAAAKAKATALPTTRPPQALPSVGGTTLAVPKAKASSFWTTVRGPARPDPAKAKALQTTAPKVWLDRLNKVTLEESVPQVGAPQAWSAGHDGTGATVAVLDTGVDRSHPDLADKIVAAESFVPGLDVADGHGHGTHVAATVAGTGAASGGRRKGVAPGARLLIGKVCDNHGSCPDSAMIAGMEWATAQGADIVSLSVGGNPSDGTDVLSQAVNRLTATTDTLFVIAAGNAGSSEFTVSSPGAADAALTVGAVDKADALAPFSSRGPRGPKLAGDYAIKPEISAPGVGIVAARAAGTHMGAPVDERYTAADGTSMATPHVSGAAAILAAQHPDWGAEELKAALVSTATDAGHTVYQQGGGRLDIGRASAQQVRVSPALLDFRAITAGKPAPGPKTLTFTNPTDKAVTLDLTATVKTTTGGATDGALKLSASQVTVPAKGDATVTATLDLAATQLNTTYTGRVVARSTDGVELAAAVGFAVLPKVHKLTVVTPPRGDDDCQSTKCPAVGDWFRAVGMDGAARGYSDMVWGGDGADFNDGRATFTLPEGTYSVRSLSQWFVDNVPQHGWLVDPEVTVDKDVEVVLDPNRARRITVSVPQPADRYSSEMLFCRADTAGGIVDGCDIVWAPNTWVLPSKPVTKGSYKFSANWMLGVKTVRMAVTGTDPLDLRPVMSSYADKEAAQFPAGKRTYRVVDVGAGTAEDYAKVDVRGALAFQSRLCQVFQSRLDRAAAAGAAGVLTAVVPMAEDPICHLPQADRSPFPGTVPSAQIPAAQTAALVDRLAKGPVTVEVTGSPDTPYVYNITAQEPAGVPAKVDYRYTDEDFAVVDNHLHATAPSQFLLQDSGFRIDNAILVGSTGAWLRGPRTVREYLAPVSADTLHWRRVTVEGSGQGALCNLGGFRYGRCEQAVDTFPHRTRRDIHWNVDPTAVGAPTIPDGAQEAGLPALCSGCREGDAFSALTNLTTAESKHWRGYVDAADSETHLYRNGTEVAATPYKVTASPFQGTLNRYQLPAEAASYRLTQKFGGTSTAWKFTSSGVTRDRTPAGTVCVQAYQSGAAIPCRAEPLIFLRYGADVNLANAIPAGRANQLTITAYHQAPDAPRIVGLRTQYSTDGGATWREALTVPTGGGSYRALLLPSRAGETTVSLRTTAWDAAGNQVEQTVLDAIGLSGKK